MFENSFSHNVIDFFDYLFIDYLGILISGPSGSGKSALAQWLMRERRSKYRSVAVSCADLVHKVLL